MKQFIFLLLALLIIITELQGQWEVVNEGVSGRFNTIDFVNENTGWLGGLRGKILKTEDGGETWFTLPFDGDFSTAHFDFISNNMGWAIANNYQSDFEGDVILKTVDGGQSWSPLKEGRSSKLYSIYAVNDSVVYAAGDSVILKTSDGGLSWIDISLNDTNPSYRSICFLNNDTGFVAGKGEFYDEQQGWDYIILRTSDGGITWYKTTFPHINSLRDLQFINDTTAYFVCHDYLGSYLYETKDLGKNWRLKFKSQYGISTLKFTSADTAYAVQDDSSSFQYFTQSLDGGVTWERRSFISQYGNYMIYILNDHVRFLYGSYGGNGILLRSIDEGHHWIIQKLLCSFYKSFFFDKNTGFAIGGRPWALHTHGWGCMLKTRNGCKTWEFSLETLAIPPSLFYLNSLVGFISIPIWVSSSGPESTSIYKTSDGGDNWISICNGDLYGINVDELWFLNEQKGWIINNWGLSVISGTSDGGKTWQTGWQNQDTSKQGSDLRSLYFINENLGWAVGESGIIVKYTEQNQWQLQSSVTDLPLTDVFFSNEQYGWIAGGYNNLVEGNYRFILLRTKNGGESWQEIPDINYQINDTYFTDHLHGWTVGSDTSNQGIILETFDGGDNWNIVVENLPAPLNAVNFKDSSVWAIGDNGLVLRTDYVNTWIDHNTGKVYPDEYCLFQNYPNPFNPKTTIEYTLRAQHTVPQHINLSIYNLLGQKVATLVNKKQAPGSYKVKWDASGFASGIYIYQLKVKGQKQAAVFTKKLILIK